MVFFLICILEFCIASLFFLILCEFFWGGKYVFNTLETLAAQWQLCPGPLFSISNQVVLHFLLAICCRRRCTVVLLIQHLATLHPYQHCHAVVIIVLDFMPIFNVSDPIVFDCRAVFFVAFIPISIVMLSSYWPQLCVCPIFSSSFNNMYLPMQMFASTTPFSPRQLFRQWI